MVIALRRSAAHRPTALEVLRKHRMIKAVLASANRLRTDDDYLGSLIFEGMGRKIIEGFLLGYIGLAVLFIVAREIIVRIGGR